MEIAPHLGFSLIIASFGMSYYGDKEIKGLLGQSTSVFEKYIEATEKRAKVGRWLGPLFVVALMLPLRSKHPTVRIFGFMLGLLLIGVNTLAEWEKIRLICRLAPEHSMVARVWIICADLCLAAGTIILQHEMLTDYS